MKKLTKAEEELMQIIWTLEECTVGDVRQAIADEKGGEKPPHSTISTMLRILVDKGFLTHKTYGRTFVYRPTLTREDYGKQSVRSLLQRYFGGSANRLVSHLVNEQELTAEELNELLDQLEDDGKV